MLMLPSFRSAVMWRRAQIRMDLLQGQLKQSTTLERQLHALEAQLASKPSSQGPATASGVSGAQARSILEQVYGTLKQTVAASGGGSVTPQQAFDLLRFVHRTCALICCSYGIVVSCSSASQKGSTEYGASSDVC